MRFNGLVLAVASVALAACGGGADKPADSAAAPAAGAGATTAAAAPAAAQAPATGKWHEVAMVGDEKGYRYEPANVTVKVGDGVRFNMVSGGPHNVQFENVAADAKSQLMTNMPNQLTELGSPILINAGEKYEMTFNGVKPGKYDFVCQPHLANNMRGSITVQ